MIHDSSTTSLLSQTTPHKSVTPTAPKKDFEAAFADLQSMYGTNSHIPTPDHKLEKPKLEKPRLEKPRLEKPSLEKPRLEKPKDRTPTPSSSSPRNEECSKGFSPKKIFRWFSIPR